MRFIRRSKIALSLLRDTPGWRARTQMIGRMYHASRRSRLAPRPGVAPDPLADVWAEYFLLNYFSRDFRVSVEATPPRIWFAVPQLDPKVIFGGYIALMQLVRVLQAQGYATGFIVQAGFSGREALLREFAGNPMVHPILAAAEFQPLDPARTLHVGADDMLVAYNWTTALLAAKIVGKLRSRAYYYFVQEDERIFYLNDSTRFLAESLYHQDIPPRLICNSAKLRDHLLREGLVAPGTEAFVFEQAIPAADLSRLAARDAGGGPRRFVFYGRPEEHAKRNLFTIALLAISQAARSGAFEGAPWEFYMMGSNAMGERFDLDGLTIRTLPRTGYQDYLKSLAGFDLGMVLMYAPHPSVPPFELVRSGVVTVVNTQSNRDAAWYRGVSANFEPAAPRVEAIAAALGSGAARVDRMAARRAAAQSYHPLTWEESFADLPTELSHPVFDGAKGRHRDEPRRYATFPAT